MMLDLVSERTPELKDAAASMESAGLTRRARVAGEATYVFKRSYSLPVEARGAVEHNGTVRDEGPMMS